LKFTEVLLREAEEQHPLAGHGYDGRVVRLGSQLNVVRGCEHVDDIQAEEDREDETTLRHPSQHPTTRCHDRLKGRLERSTQKVSCQILKEAVDS
jgi:hypothetical protein